MRVAGFHRLAEQEALAISAAELLEPIAHFFVLHPFCHHGKVQAVGQVKDRPHNGIWLISPRHRLHEALVDLHHIKGEALQIAEGRVARAEIIQRQLHAEALDLLQHTRRHVRIVHHQRLGDFQPQAAGRDLTARQKVLDPGRQIIEQLAA